MINKYFNILNVNTFTIYYIKNIIKKDIIRGRGFKLFMIYNLKYKKYEI